LKSWIGHQISRDPGSTSVCTIHGSSSLCLSCVKNNQTKRGHYSKRKLWSFRHMRQIISWNGTNIRHDSRVRKTQRWYCSQCATRHWLIPATLGLQHNARFQESSGSSNWPREDHIYHNRLGPCIGKRAHRVPPWALENLR
jgi:hypothetical protein